MLQNAYFLAKVGADTAENEQHFAEICQKLAPPEQETPWGGAVGAKGAKEGGRKQHGASTGVKSEVCSPICIYDSPVGLNFKTDYTISIRTCPWLC